MADIERLHAPRRTVANGIRRCYFGLHYDLHAREGDDKLGTRCDRKELVPMLKLMAPTVTLAMADSAAPLTLLSVMPFVMNTSEFQVLPLFGEVHYKGAEFQVR